MPVWTARTWFEQLFADKYPSAFTVNGFSTCDHRDRDRELMASPASGNGWWVRLPNILRRPIDFAEPASRITSGALMKSLACWDRMS